MFLKFLFDYQDNDVFFRIVKIFINDFRNHISYSINTQQKKELCFKDFRSTYSSGRKLTSLFIHYDK